MTNSVFEKYESKSYPFRFSGQIVTTTPMAGGIPTDPKVAEGWIKTKLGITDEVLIQKMVAETMLDMDDPDGDEAVKAVSDMRHLTGFKRDAEGVLFYEGRSLKAALKEAASVATNAGKINAKGWGSPTDATYKKGIKAWFPEHVFVEDDRITLGVRQADDVVQSFGANRYGAHIEYFEIVENATIDFTVETDHKFTDEQWAHIWLTGQKQGIGARRSQGYGRYEVTRWEPAS